MASRTSLRRSLRAYQIYGANTNVGKTIMSTILCKAFARNFPKEKTFYLKPVSTGPLEEADDGHISRFSPQTKTACLYQFDEAVSPHIAARSSKPLSDAEIQEKVLTHLSTCSSSAPGTLLLETAGGVHSPTPSGTSQADLYRPLRFPICLVADHKLGGISASISAFESLHIRGYDLETILQFSDETYQNHSYLKSYFNERGIFSLAIPPPPPKGATEQEDYEAMFEYYEIMSKRDEVTETIHNLAESHTKRILDLEGMSSKAYKTIWYPFTQHNDISPETIMAIDSASGDSFQTHTTSSTREAETSEENILTPTFDGSASWWTQGLGHGSPTLSLAAAHAAGRYGHVMFAGTVHEPALALAETLLSSLNNHRLSRCFFSDNGSTGMEVAIKMALTATCERYGYSEEDKAKLGVIGLKGSYHGDTIGAMDASEPSTYNEKVHWYEGRGYWFDFPEVKCKKGKWIISPPEEMRRDIECFSDDINLEFDTLYEVFDIEERQPSSVYHSAYEMFIERKLEQLVKEEGMRFGALVMEPVLLGAGGMLFADPLFQNILAKSVRRISGSTSPIDLFGHSPLNETICSASRPDRPLPDTHTTTWTGLPIIHDEVFTGLFRLGRLSSSSFLQINPDISVHAKLLTGGLVPLCTTLASESIYNAFLGSEKRDALLHGHSYTAHPVGCHVANTSLKALMELDTGGAWDEYKADWRGKVAAVEEVIETETDKEEKVSWEKQQVWSVWSKDFVDRISFSNEVESLIALGSVLAIKLQDENAGYSSTAATGLQKRLLEGTPDFKIHVRVLGNVLYIMASQTSKPETLQNIEKLLIKELL